MAAFFAKGRASSVAASDDDEIDPLTVRTPSVSRMNSLVEPDRSSFQSLMLPRARFLPVTGPPSRRATLYGTWTAEVSHFRHRSQALLDRTRTPAPAWEKWRKPEGELAKIKNMKVREFYENQNCLIDDLLYVDEILESPIPHKILHSYHHRHHQDSIGCCSQPPSRRVSSVHEDEETNLLASAAFPSNRDEQETRVVYFAILVNFLANVILLIAKIIASLTSSSLSIIASLVDSALDFLSTLIIFAVSRIVAQRDWKSQFNFPVGKARLEPIGVLVFSVIMIVSFMQVFVEAVHRLLYEESRYSIIRLDPPAIIIMLSTVVVKLGCYFWSKSIQNSGLQALAQDAMNDVVFNSASLIIPLIGQWFEIWWLDSVGAIFISLYIIYEWINTERAHGHIQNLTGRQASIAQLQQIVYMTSRFSDQILKVMNVSGYHAGDNILVEIDVVLNEKTPLRDVHDLGEALQYSIESLPGVERAFVHCDYAIENPTGHLRPYG